MDRVTASDQAQHWQRRLRKLKLPLFQTDRAELLKQLGDPNSTALRIGQGLSRQPITCLHLFSESNRYEFSADSVVDPSHAISMLGIDNCASLLRALPVFPAADGANASFKHAVSNSLLAAEWAEYLASTLRLAHRRDTYWAALFHRSSRWLLALIAPEKLEALQRKPGESAFPNGLSKEQQLMGIDGWQLGQLHPLLQRLPSISAEHFKSYTKIQAKEWLALSRLALCKSQPQTAKRRGRYLDILEGNPNLKGLKNHSAGAVILANTLIDELDYCWYSHQSRRLLRITAAWLQKPVDQVEAKLKQLALKISHQHPEFGPGPAARMLAQWPNQSDRAWQPSAAKKAQTDAAQAKKMTVGRDMALIKKVHQRLRQQENTSFKQLMETLLKGLHRGLGAEHVTLWLPHSNRNMLIPQYALADIEPIRSPIGLSRPSLFNKLLEKPRELRIPPGHVYWSQLPGYFKANTSESECIFRSLFHRDRPIAVLYLDRGDSHRGFLDQEINLFHTLIRDFEWALQQVSTRKNSAKARTAPVQSNQQ